MSKPEDPEPEFRIDVPEELKGGVYANFLNVWHSPYEFTLDFAATLEPEAAGEGGITIPCRLAARVKVPITIIFELIQELNDEMTNYERLFGEIRRPGEGRGE